MKRSRGEMSSLSGAGAYIIRPWRDCSIISISRVKRAGPRPLTWFRFDSHSCSAYTYSRGGTMRGATRNVEKGTWARTRARAWPPLAARERAPRKTKRGVASITRGSRLFKERALRHVGIEGSSTEKRWLPSLALRPTQHVRIWGEIWTWSLNRNLAGNRLFLQLDQCFPIFSNVSATPVTNNSYHLNSEFLTWRKRKRPSTSRFEQASKERDIHERKK